MFLTVSQRNLGAISFENLRFELRCLFFDEHLEMFAVEASFVFQMFPIEGFHNGDWQSRQVISISIFCDILIGSGVTASRVMMNASS
ncbi:hypothetical protein CSA56_10785 [candidate division KSB3 bacterium]|uniref:Uncharacterized protein n=1 Tax=candidate division KSB3 bacterium TaxID=2044937 RepID=A0A2G6KD27_9BACT|nr:MAG: hypothetical protein CSA56_10785 [candidate division KSB3 bacterium]